MFMLQPGGENDQGTGKKGIKWHGSVCTGTKLCICLGGVLLPQAGSLCALHLPVPIKIDDVPALMEAEKEPGNGEDRYSSKIISDLDKGQEDNRIG